MTTTTAAAATDDTTTIDANTVTQRAVFIRITKGKLGVRRKAHAVKVNRATPMSDQFAGGNVVTDAEPDMVSVSKKVLDCPEYDAIIKLYNDVRRYMDGVMLRTSLAGAGVYPVAAGDLDDVYERLEAFREEWRPLVDAFCDVYEQRCEESDAKLGSLSAHTDHPPLSRVRAAFHFDWLPLSFDVPGALKHMSKARADRERDRIRAQLTSAAAEIQQGMCQAFGELIAHMTASLDPTTDGENKDGTPKRKRFYGSRLQHLTSFLEHSATRNITDDAALASLAAEAKALIDGVDADMIRDNDDLRDALQVEFVRLQTQLDTMTTADAPRRYINLDGDA